MAARKRLSPPHVARQHATAWAIHRRRGRLLDAKATASDADLIAEAVRAGRVTKLPDGYAANAPRWGAFAVTGTGRRM